MPEISRFLGIVIAIYYNDHAPPHFHAQYGEHKVKIGISDGHILAGQLPRRAEKLVFEWLDLHRAELMQDWELAEQRKPLFKIEPLE